ncbi:MAG TPA: hypothetical protein VL486_01295 [Verrucomicrobiae bacterium]|nr:hypothetical protein [Verrucomicrobiae bacterium]
MKVESLSRRAAEDLRAEVPVLSSLHATIGLDGFVDEIVTVVDKRESPTRFTRVPTISAFAERLARAAGRSSNVELVVERVKLGGNGPIMANALAAVGVRVACIGCLGCPQIHSAFAELVAHATVHSIAEPGHTDALEFDDGKLMLGKQQPLQDVTWQTLVERVGRDRLRTLLSEADLVGLQSWTMVPCMSDIWEHMLTELCPGFSPGRTRRMFFDLADPEKRDRKDIARALELLGQFQKFFATHLGLNEKEGFSVGRVLGYRGATVGETAVKSVAEFILGKLGISTVVVHPREYAVAASADGVSKVTGPSVGKPLISTGGGDHFNAGFCLGKLLGADDEIALQLGVGASGYYVRTGKTPRVNELADFLHSL